MLVKVFGFMAKITFTFHEAANTGQHFPETFGVSLHCQYVCVLMLHKVGWLTSVQPQRFGLFTAHAYPATPLIIVSVGVGRSTKRRTFAAFNATTDKDFTLWKFGELNYHLIFNVRPLSRGYAAGPLT